MVDLYTRICNDRLGPQLLEVNDSLSNVKNGLASCASELYQCIEACCDVSVSSDQVAENSPGTDFHRQCREPPNNFPFFISKSSSGCLKVSDSVRKQSDDDAPCKNKRQLKSRRVDPKPMKLCIRISSL
eukprot:763088-Hanusia_phi.AAC.8